MIKVLRQTLRHEGGTKFYEALTFSNTKDEIYVVVFRWGKEPSSSMGGEVKVQWFASSAMAAGAVSSKFAEKTKRGYGHATSGSVIAGPTVAEIRAFLPHAIKKDAAGEMTFAMKLLGSLVDVGSETRTRQDDEIVLEEPDLDHGAGWASW